VPCRSFDAFALALGKRVLLRAERVKGTLDGYLSKVPRALDDGLHGASTLGESVPYPTW
jgi:hypothetical protein